MDEIKHKLPTLDATYLQSAALNFAILFVDDERQSRKYFKKLLGKKYAIYLAANVNEALEVLSLHGDEIGVLVTDQQMPGQKGTDLLKIMNKQYRQIVCLFTSAYTEFDDAVTAINSTHIYRYIEKPWDIATLLDAVTAAMTLFESQHQENSMLEKRQKDLYFLASSMVTELRTPLTKISCSAKLIKRELDRLNNLYIPDQVNQNVVNLPSASPSDINQSSGVATAVPLIMQQHHATLELLNGVGIEAGKAQLYIDSILMHTKNTEDKGFEKHSVLSCLKDVILRFPFEDDQQKMVEIKGPDFIPNTSSLAMMQVFSHLIKNAIESLARSKKESKQLIITTVAMDGMNSIQFRDNGVGIPDAAKPFIFDTFYTSKHRSGMGIGLAYSKNILKKSGATITCRSVEGEYTELSIFWAQHCKKGTTVS